jgi:hypothetical protein
MKPNLITHSLHRVALGKRPMVLLRGLVWYWENGGVSFLTQRAQEGTGALRIFLTQRTRRGTQMPRSLMLSQGLGKDGCCAIILALTSPSHIC